MRVLLRRKRGEEVGYPYHRKGGDREVFNIHFNRFLSYVSVFGYIYLVTLFFFKVVEVKPLLLLQ